MGEVRLRRKYRRYTTPVVVLGEPEELDRDWALEHLLEKVRAALASRDTDSPRTEREIASYINN